MVIILKMNQTHKRFSSGISFCEQVAGASLSIRHQCRISLMVGRCAVKRRGRGSIPLFYRCTQFHLFYFYCERSLEGGYRFWNERSLVRVQPLPKGSVAQLARALKNPLSKFISHSVLATGRTLKVISLLDYPLSNPHLWSYFAPLVQRTECPATNREVASSILAGSKLKER